MESLPELLMRRLQEHHQEPQISVLRRTASPLHLDGRSLESAARDLIDRWRNEFGAGSHIFILTLPPGETFLTALLAGLMGGHTLVPTPLPRPGSRSDRLFHIARDCHATAILCVESMRNTIRHALTGAGMAHMPCPIVALDTAATPTIPNRERKAGGPAPAIIQYTSGSTRLPKGVRIFGSQILANCALVQRAWDMNASTRFVNWLPHYHDMGLMGGILYPLLSGAYSVQMSPLDIVRQPASWLRAVSDYRATFSGGPAFAFADCLRRITPEECEGLDLSSWARAFCGAEPIPAGLLPAFRHRFAPHGLPPQAVFGCYGLAETTLFAAGAPEVGELPMPPSGCMAVHPCRLTDATRPNLLIVDPESCTPMADGAQGEIWLRGPSNAEGYVNLPDETAALFGASLASEVDNTWLRTGDLGVVEQELLYITGRLKDTLIANGRKIAAAELEWLAASINEALNPLGAAAFMADTAQSASAVLLIELKSGHTMPERPDIVCQAIERAVLGEWGIRLQDIRILPRGRLERTSSGKIRRQAIAEGYRLGSIPPSPEMAPSGRYDDES